VTNTPRTSGGFGLASFPGLAMGPSPADGPGLPEHRCRRVVEIGQKAAAGGDPKLARGLKRGLAPYKLRGSGRRIAEEGLGGHR
jgi:hypothetical protein